MDGRQIYGHCEHNGVQYGVRLVIEFLLYNACQVEIDNTAYGIVLLVVAFCKVELL